MKNIYNKELNDFTRLTRHYQDWEVELAKPNKDYITTDYFCPRRDVSYDDCLNKLGQLEDIEEKLGIDLTTLFKALFNNKFYALNPYGFDTQVKIIECHGISFEKSEYKGYAIGGYFSLPSELFNHCSWSIKDYGKTWALTKEELL